VGYYSWWTPEFNHNIAQIPFWAAISFVLWRAVERRSIVWWTLFGVVAASGLYAKLEVSLLLVTAAAWLLHDTDGRRSLLGPGPWIGLVLFLILAAPLAFWLFANDFQPFKYAAERASQRGVGVHVFLSSVLLTLAGLVAMLVVSGLIAPRRGDVSSVTHEVVGEREQRFLLVMTGGPLVLAITAALAARTGLRPAWGSCMFSLVGLLAVALTSDRFNSRVMRRVFNFAALLLIVAPIVYATNMAWGYHIFSKPRLVNWPQAEIANRMGELWRRETGRPLRIVAGGRWVAGVVGVSSADKPSIFTDGELALSPWITPWRISNEGMLIVWQKTEHFPRSLKPYLALPSRGQEHFRLPGPSSAEIVLNYIIVPPKAPQTRED
jgi:4-amino-4-deoxy-L-arabinose transferase-like glycosyltransferase